MPTSDRYAQIDVALIDPPKRFKRDALDPEKLAELADSMAAEGLHQAIGVIGPDEHGRYECDWGWRRVNAARLLQWPAIEARVFPLGTDPALARASENLQREQLTPVEEARMIQDMLDHGHNVPAVARLFRRTRAWVDARLALLGYPDDVRQAVHDRRLPLAVAEQLAGIDHDGYRAELLGEAERTGATAATAACWATHYQADRERIVGNLLTVQEIAAAREAFVVYHRCEACGDERPYTETRSFRFCARCTGELLDGLHGRPSSPAPSA